MKNIRLWSRWAVAAVLFTIAIAVHAQTYSVVYNFGDVFLDAAFPQYSGIIAQGRDGNLYTTTPYGGTNDYGTVVRITPAGQATVLYNFNHTDPDEAFPFSGLTLGADGDLYGTTLGERANLGGKVFKVTSNGQVTFLHTFAAGEGQHPFAPPILASDGNLYGTTTLGGKSGNGTVYRITPSGEFKTIASLDYKHGYYPIAPLIMGVDGNLYGTAWEGGTHGTGTVFRVTLKGAVTVLRSFDWASGAYPRAPLVQDNDGNLYGVADEGGTNGFGTMFRISPDRKFKVLHSLKASEGEYSAAGLVLGTDGNLYGNTYGASNNGTIYRITPAGEFSVLHAFDMVHGGHPEVTMTQHSGGVLYGDTVSGGVHSYGTFYTLDAGLPAFAKLVPNAAKTGSTVGILGQGLNGATAVSFNGKAAPFNLVSDTFLTATVPNGATTGPVKVTLGGNSLNSYRNFQVVPVITSFSPSSGQVGTQVTITGVSLSQTSLVEFGSTTASFTVNSDKQVTATVPANAKSAKITITTAGGTAVSSASFTVTP